MSNITELTFPYEYKELEPNEKVALGKSYLALRDFVRLGPKGYAVFRRYQTDAANIYNMPLRTSDIFVASILRSGTTLTQELVWLVASDFDYAAAEIPLLRRFPFLDQFMYYEENMTNNINIEDDDRKEFIRDILLRASMPVSRMLATAPSPRFVKTHLPLSLLPPTILDTAKVVYVARDPRDVAVSSFHHSKLFKRLHLTEDFKEFWNLFTRGLFTLTPYFEHVKEAWEMRHHPNMLFLFYEELLKDLPGTVHRVAKFLGKEVTEEQMDRLCDHLKFDNFKNNKSVNYEELREFDLLAKDENFVRKGKAGGWREYFDAEMCAQAQRWIDDNLRGTDLRFPTMEKPS